MNLNEVKQELRSYLDANVTLQLVSAPGLGKSETIRDAVAEFSRQDGFEWGLATVLAAAYTPPDVMGYLMPSTTKVTNAATGVEEEVLTSKFSMPPWLMSDEGKPMNSYKRGVVFFDEWDKIEPDTKRCLANVLLNGVAGQWMAHEGIGFITAANRSEDRSGSTKEYDFIINRRAELHIRPDVRSWEDWAVRNNVAPIGITFAVKNTDVVFSGKVPEKQGPYCTPRTLVMGLKLIAKHIDTRTGKLIGLDDESTETRINEKLTGLWGAAATNAFLVWTRMATEIPEFDDIVANPKGDDDKVYVPSKPDAKMMCAYDLAHRVTLETASKVVDYALRLPKEFQLVFGTAAVKRNFRLLSSPAFTDKFIPENQGIIALVASN